MPNAKTLREVMDFQHCLCCIRVLGGGGGGRKALFAQEQYKVLLGGEAALINYALF